MPYGRVGGVGDLCGVVLRWPMGCMWPMRRCFRWPIYEMYVGGLWQNRVVSGISIY